MFFVRGLMGDHTSGFSLGGLEKWKTSLVTLTSKAVVYGWDGQVWMV